jgi:CRP/FNR family transcriptional regulator, cyclic AMP receptor protein
MIDSNPVSSVVSSVEQFLSDPMLGGRRQTVPAGTILHEPGSRARSVYFVHSGQVRVHQIGPDQSARLVEILGPGEWFGSAALAGDPENESRATAVGQTNLTEVPADRVIAALERNPLAAVELVKQLAKRVLAAREDAARLVFDDCNERLIKTLLRFSISAAASPRETGIVLRITHQQLAQAVGVARETVSLALTQLRHQNLLRTGRNQLFFDPEALRRFQGTRKAPVIVEQVPVEQVA